MLILLYELTFNKIKAVAYEEGVALKLKYNLTHFSETNIHIEKEIHQVSLLFGLFLSDK